MKMDPPYPQSNFGNGFYAPKKTSVQHMNPPSKSNNMKVGENADTTPQKPQTQSLIYLPPSYLFSLDIGVLWQ